MRSATLLLAVGATLFGVLLGIGWLCTQVEPGTWVGAADVGVLQWLVAHRVPSLDRVSLDVVDLASTTVVLMSGAVAGVVAALMLRRGWPLVLLTVALVGELVLFLNAAIVVGRPRPAVPHLDAPLPPTSSFPSGHTAAAICLYGGVAAIVLRAVRAWWRWLVLGVAVFVIVAVAAARLYRGAHYPHRRAGECGVRGALAAGHNSGVRTVGWPITRWAPIYAWVHSPRGSRPRRRLGCV